MQEITAAVFEKCREPRPYPVEVWSQSLGTAHGAAHVPVA